MDQKEILSSNKYEWEVFILAKFWQKQGFYKKIPQGFVLRDSLNILYYLVFIWWAVKESNLQPTD